MAVRIRKLARELDRTPVELIGVLHALGFQRYRSPDDMLPGPAVAKLRKGLAQGVRPVEVEVKSRRRESEIETLARGGDVMSRLVPGVVAASHRAPAARTAPPPPAPARPVAAAPPPAVKAVSVPESTPRALDASLEVLESQRRAMESERAAWAAERAELERQRMQQEARQRSLDAEAESISQLRAALEAEREALDAARLKVTATIEAPQTTTLQDLLEQRGLRGADEFERALTSLADARLLRDVLWTIRLDPPDALERVLRERMVLGAGEAHPVAGKGAAWVTVAPARAEVPENGELGRLIAQVGERWMLFGCRKVRVVGGAPRWHRVLRAMIDPRVELIQQAARVRSPVAARADVADADAVLLWDVEVDEEARAIYASARPTVVTVNSSSFTDLLESVLEHFTD